MHGHFINTCPRCGSVSQCRCMSSSPKDKTQIPCTTCRSDATASQDAPPKPSPVRPCDVGSPQSVQERILCAAIWVDDGQKHPHQPTNIQTGVVFCGHRHHNCIVAAAVAFPSIPVDRNQGFLTSWNRYVDRSQAAQIAIDAGQASPKAMRKSRLLFSEDLY